MGKSMTKFYVDGTAALKPKRYSQSLDSGTFVAFKGSSQHNRTRLQRNQAESGSDPRAKSILQDVLERSEMACSLLTEDVKGVSYGLFTPSNIASISTACAIIAIISIAIGA